MKTNPAGGTSAPASTPMADIYTGLFYGQYEPGSGFDFQSFMSYDLKQRHGGGSILIG